jgi:cyclophilin family peptidyl-prolyl cis-trans isomerase
LAALPTAVTLRAGAPLQIPLDGFDADGDSLVFAHSLSNKTVSTSFSPSTNRSLKVSVSHASSGASDPAFNGDLILKLFEDKAPITTARVIQLAQSGFYNNLSFHRVMDNFVIQGGDPLGNGTGGSGVGFDDEFASGYQFTGSGQLAMAKSYDDTNDSQFFITEGPQRHLDFNHTIFGQLVEGEAVRDRISAVPTDANGKPLGAVTITSVSVIDDRQNGVLTLSVPNNVTSGSVDVSVVARDPSGQDSVARTFTVTIAPDTTDDPPILGPVADLVTRANTPVSFQLTSSDVEGTLPAYLNWAGIYQNFQLNHPEIGARYLPPDSAGNVTAAVDFTTGLATVTPTNNVAGVFPIYVGVAQDVGAYDSQVVPLFVSPAAPASIDLLGVTDTGVSPIDNVVRLDNSGAASRLQFLVTGVLPGSVVKIMDGGTVIGQANVSAGATQVVVTTSGAAALADGTHNLTATQTLANYAWGVGNRSGVTDLVSLGSAGLAVTVDTAAPGVAVAPFDVSVAPQGLTLTFSEDVADTLAAGDLKVTNVATGATVAVATLTPVGGGGYRFTFDVPGGVLPDGNYHAALAAGDVTDRAGNALAAGVGVDFYVLAGDANRDRTVNFDDLLVVAKNYNKVGVTYAEGDLNYDGLVNFDDLLVLAKAYNKTLAAPLAAAPALEASTVTAAVAPTTATTAESTSDDSVLADPSPVRPAPAKPKPAAKPAGRN